MYWPLIHDAPLMHYIAWRMLSGDVPYRDIFDMNMPGTYFIHIAVLTLLGKGDLAWRVFDIAWVIFSASTIALFCRPFGRLAALFSAFFYVAFHLTTGPPQMGQRDFLMCPFLMLSAHFFSKSFENQDVKRSLFWSGLFLGLAMTIKPLACMLLAMFAALSIHVLRKEKKDYVKGFGMLIVGASVGPLLVLSWLISNDALVAFLAIFKHWLPLYGELEREPISIMLLTIWHGLLPVIPACILSLPLLYFFKPSLKYIRLVTLSLGVMYAVLQYFIQGKGWPYHLEPFYFFLFTLMIVFYYSFTVSKSPYIRYGVTAVLFFLALPTSLNAIVISQGNDEILPGMKPSVNQLVMDLSAHHLSDEDTVQVLDSTIGGIHALYRLGVRQPTRFIYDIQFFTGTEQPFIQNLRQEFIETLKDQQPTAIVVFHETWIPPYNISRFETFPQFSEILKNRYKLDQQRDAYSLYVAKT